MKRYLCLLCLVSLFASCEKVIEIDPLMSPSELVLNAVPSAGQQLFVNFAYSHFFLDTTNNHPVANADMVVSINGRDYRPSSVDRCNYFFDYILQPEDSLAIRIDAGGNVVTAHTTVPQMPQMTVPTVFVDTTSSALRLLVINFNLSDPAGQKDYYCFRITERDSGAKYHPFLDYYDTIDTVRTSYFFCYDSVLTSSPDATPTTYGYPFYGQFLTSDANFDGQVHNTTLLFTILRDTNEIQPFIHQYSLTVEKVSADRFRYMQDVAAGNTITALITEPPAVYSNVSGALGIFAGTAKRTFPLITLSEGREVLGRTSRPRR